MALVVTIAGLKKLAEDGVNSLADDVWILFTNDHTPTVDSVLGDLDEANYDGYERKDVAIESSDPDEQDHLVTFEQRDFVADTPVEEPVEVYGAALVSGIGETEWLVAAERFEDAPLTIDDDHPTLRLKPKLRARNCPPEEEP